MRQVTCYGLLLLGLLMPLLVGFYAYQLNHEVRHMHCVAACPLTPAQQASVDQATQLGWLSLVPGVLCLGGGMLLAWRARQLRQAFAALMVALALLLPALAGVDLARIEVQTRDARCIGQNRGCSPAGIEYYTAMLARRQRGLALIGGGGGMLLALAFVVGRRRGEEAVAEVG